MENNKNENVDQKVKAPLADEKHQLDPTIKGNNDQTQQKEPGKLPDDELGVDHNSDPIIAKKQ
jgi:hypothetical protein